VMDLAMEEQLRKKGMLGEEAATEPAREPAPANTEPMAPTGIEGTIPVKGNS
jgi:hypothetical protein